MPRRCRWPAPVRTPTLGGADSGLRDDAPDVVGREEVVYRAGPRHDAHEAVHRLLVSLHRSQQLLRLDLGDLEPRLIAGELVDRLSRLVAGALVSGQRLVVRPAPGEDVVERQR